MRMHASVHKYSQTHVQRGLKQLVNEARTKIYRSNGRNSLYLPSTLVGDDRFPFQVGEELTVRIQGEELIVEKARKK